MGKYRKRPVVVEAFKWTGDENQTEDPEWIVEAIRKGSVWFTDQGMVIKTLEGEHLARPGDYIIRGIKGELYPCKPEIFKETYEKVEKMIDVMKPVNHDLLTSKYTDVYHEEDFKYNAPHNFEVRKVSEGDMLQEIHFQEGPIKEHGVNGVANEDLIAMVICRLEHFQKSEFACRENAMAITKLEEALLWLRKRTMGRAKRGVEGTYIK